MISFDYQPSTKHSTINIDGLDTEKHFIKNHYAKQYKSIGKGDWNGWAVNISDYKGVSKGCLIYVDAVYACDLDGE